MTDNPWFQWKGDRLQVIDQTRLPLEVHLLELTTATETVDAIARLAVRGAPTIGAVGGYGVVLGLLEDFPVDLQQARQRLDDVVDYIGSARPTAIALRVAVEGVRRAASAASSTAEMLDLAVKAAGDFVQQDRASCDAMAANGVELLRGTRRFLTHCNTGRVATTGRGTALAVLYALHDTGDALEVLASESRPLLQGSRLTAWELREAGIDVRVIADGAGAAALSAGLVDAVIVGADRIAMNGDTANKIGTFAHAIAAKRFGVPFYVAAPINTFDANTATGADIEIELRDASELFRVGGVTVGDVETGAWNPAFDVTPADLITAFITDRGVLHPPFLDSIRKAIVSEQSKAPDA